MYAVNRVVEEREVSAPLSAVVCGGGGYISVITASSSPRTIDMSDYYVLRSQTAELYAVTATLRLRFRIMPAESDSGEVWDEWAYAFACDTVSPSFHQYLVVL